MSVASCQSPRVPRSAPAGRACAGTRHTYSGLGADHGDADAPPYLCMTLQGLNTITRSRCHQHSACTQFVFASPLRDALIAHLPSMRLSARMSLSIWRSSHSSSELSGTLSIIESSGSASTRSTAALAAAALAPFMPNTSEPTPTSAATGSAGPPGSFPTAPSRLPRRPTAERSPFRRSPLFQPEGTPLFGREMLLRMMAAARSASSSSISASV
mmetsp:Transcript_18030/g.46082  ORF Transcript_18030/g.46082 Transcript_18030/m.46082 type:complete len:214 (+) Transcript_18030:147-788(+)